MKKSIEIQKDKLKLVFIPFLAALVVLLIVYSFLDWLLFIRLGLFSVENAVRAVVIPMVLSGLVVLFYLRPKLRALELGGPDKNWRDFYSLICWLVLTAPMVFSHSYLDTFSGELTEINSVSDISNQPPTKFYKVKNYYIDKSKPYIYSNSKIGGKYNQDLNMYFYYVVPILDTLQQPKVEEPSVWLGLRYHFQIHNRVSFEEKKAEYTDFEIRTKEEFHQKDFANINYFQRADKFESEKDYKKAFPLLKQTNKQKKIILIGKEEPFEERGKGALKWFFRFCFIGPLIWLFMVLIPGPDLEQIRRMKSNDSHSNLWKDHDEYSEFLMPSGNYFFTPILIYFCLLIFTVMVFSGLEFKRADLINWGGAYGPLIQEGQWWRLLTSTFIHNSFPHLMYNMLALFFVGFFLEDRIGRYKFLLVFILTGVFASIAGFWWNDSILSVGSSGAVFGLYGALIALILTRKFSPDSGKTLLLIAGVFIVINLIVGLTDGIDNAAHIGGLVSGFIIGLILAPGLKNDEDTIF